MAGRIASGPRPGAPASPTIIARPGQIHPSMSATRSAAPAPSRQARPARIATPTAAAARSQECAEGVAIGASGPSCGLMVSGALNAPAPAGRRSAMRSPPAAVHILNPIMRGGREAPRRPAGSSVERPGCGSRASTRSEPANRQDMLRDRRVSRAGLPQPVARPTRRPRPEDKEVAHHQRPGLRHQDEGKACQINAA
jgi:hypothetical protein